MNARNREFLRDVVVFLSSAALIFIVIASAGCGTDCTYKQGFTCVHVR